MDSSQFYCRFCGDNTKQLHIHHTYYTQGAKPWEYPNDSLLCLCKNCHEKTTNMMKELKEIIAFQQLFGDVGLNQIIGYARGLMAIFNESKQFSFEDDSQVHGFAHCLQVSPPLVLDLLKANGGKISGQQIVELEK